MLADCKLAACKFKLGRKGIDTLGALDCLADGGLAGRVQMGAVLDGEVAFGVPGHFILLVDRIAFDDELSGFKRNLLGRGLRGSLLARLEFLRTLADAPH